MSWREGYQAWQLESRARYIATAFGLNLLIVFGLMWVFGSTHPGKAPAVTAIVIALGILLYGWVYYPRAKVRSELAVDREGVSSLVRNDRIDDDQLDGMQRFYRQR